MNEIKFFSAVAVVIALVLLSPFAHTIANNGFSPMPAPELATPKGDKCVEPADWMRKNHMNLLMHQRDDTVRNGIRKASHSLHNCKSCHQKRDEFCSRCHEYVGVKPECFDCHYYP